MSDETPDPTPPLAPSSAATEASTATGRAGDPHRRGGLGWGSLIAVAALVAVGWFILQQLSESDKLQDCVMSGRKNCDPLDPATGR